MKARVVFPIGLTLAAGDIILWSRVIITCGVSENQTGGWAHLCHNTPGVLVHLPLLGALGVAACTFFAWDSDRTWLLPLGVLIAVVPALFVAATVG